MPVFFHRPDFERGVVFGRSGEGFALGGNIQVFPRFQIDQFDRSRRSPAFREFEFPWGGQGLGRYDFWHFDPGSLRTVLSEDDEAGARRGQVDADARPVVFRLGGYVADGSAYRIPQLYPSATPEVHRPPETFSLGRADVIPVGPVGRPVQPQDFRRIYVRFDRQSFQRVVQRYAGDDPAFSHVADAGSGVAPDFRCGRIQPFSGFLSADQRGRTLRGVSDDGRAVVYERIQLFGGLGQHPGGFGQPQDAVSDSLGRNDPAVIDLQAVQQDVGVAVVVFESRREGDLLVGLVVDLVSEVPQDVGDGFSPFEQVAAARQVSRKFGHVFPPGLSP